ncbi:hypothetical protein Emed_004284 [Eimeria media]
MWLQCEVRRLQRRRTLKVGERRLASDDEEDEVESFVQESLMVCKGLAGPDEHQGQEPQGAGDKQQAQEPQGAGAVPRRRRRRASATLAKARGPHAHKRKRTGKSMETLKILFEMAKSSAEESLKSSHSSEDTSASSASSSLPKDTSESEEEPLTKKKKTGVLAEKSSQVAKAKTTPGEPSTSTGGPVGEDPFDIPGSLLELYLQDTLQTAEGGSIADWLIDPEADVPLSSTLSKEEEANLAGLQMGPETLPSPESLEDSSLMADLAAILATEQAQQDEVAGSSSLLVSSSGQFLDGAALPAPETAPTALESSPTATAGSPPSSPPMDQHPFYRIPASLPENVPLPFFSVVNCLRIVPEESVDGLLETVRYILEQQTLSVEDIHTLQSVGEKLISFSNRYFRPLKMNNDSNLMRSLGIRVIVAHYLLTVCEVVGPNMQKEQWWDSRMRSVLTPPPGWQPPSGPVTHSRAKDRAVRVQNLISAMNILRRGERLPAKVIVPIMQELLCSPDTLAYFKHRGWKGFRKANQRFLGISPEESESSDDDEDE